MLGGRRPIDTSATSQTFDMLFDFSGGYDRDPRIFRFGSIDDDDLDNSSSWLAATSAASLRYRVGSIRRSLTAQGRTFFNYQTTVNDTLLGGGGGLVATSAFGPRQDHRLTVEAQATYEPRWAIGLLQVPDAIGTASPSNDVAPPTGIFERRWLYMSGSGSYQRQWNRSHSSVLTYNRRHLEPVVGTGLASTFQRASFDHAWTVSRSVSIVSGYRFDENSQRDEDLGAFPSVRYQTADAGLRFTRQLSPLRRFSVSMSGGVTSVFETDATRNIDTLHPSATVLAEFELSPRFGLASRFSRSISVLAGASALPLANDIVEVSLRGSPTQRLEYSVHTSFFRAQFLAPSLTRAASADVAGANGEVRYALSHWAAVFGAYAFYHHRIDDETLVTGFPPRYERHSARIGVTFWLPVYGAF